jgi:hypothetical protein
MVELVTAGGDGVQPATLVIHADAGVVLDGEGRGSLAETESGVQLADETVRRLACDPRVEWVVERDGRAVGIGRQGRLVPGWMRRQLGFRDPECRFDGCSRKMNLVAHHIVPWSRGGPTDLDNLIRLCGTHHRLLHEAGWTMSGHPGADVRFHRSRAGPNRATRPLHRLVAAAIP